MSDDLFRPSVQVTVDAGDPHRVAAFWAEALGYEVEDHTPLVDQLRQAGRLADDDVVATTAGAGFRDLAACRDPAGRRPRLLFQRVPEKKTGKNRVHLDVHVGADRVDEEAQRLLELGATHAWTTDDRGVRCVTLRDPEGNELCLS